MWENPFSWGPIGVLLAILLPVFILGVGYMNLPPPAVTKACFCIAATVLLAWFLWVIYTYTSKSPFLIRAGCTFLVFGIIGVGLEELIHLVDIRQKQQIPNVKINLFICPDKMYYPYPLQEYVLQIQNTNPNSVPVTDFRVEFNFRNIIVEVMPTPLIVGGGGVSVGAIRIYKKDQSGAETRYEAQPLTTSITKVFSLNIEQAKIDDKIVNTNFVSFHCSKWPENVAYGASIIVDLTKEPVIRKKPDQIGTYDGTYFYKIGGRKFSQTINGNIPSDPEDKRRQEWLENVERWSKMLSDVDPKVGSLMYETKDDKWFENNNYYIEFIPYIKRGDFEIHAFRDKDNVFKVFMSNAFSKNVILRYEDLSKLKSNPRHPRHMIIVTWGNGEDKLYIDGVLVDEYPKN